MAHQGSGLPDDYQHREGGEYEYTEQQLGSGAIERLPSMERAAAAGPQEEQTGFGGLLPPTKESGMKPQVVSSAAAPQHQQQPQAQQPQEQKQE